MAKQGTILVVDDNKAVLNALEMLLAGNIFTFWNII